ncbi:MAG: type I 3-dehydroquinate dehydratase [Candidatus Heimdallarchaeota archaeon]|nr:type I 3-dehydroquinate dehydratase [Candidatus Heimdallarchaeota archaeon]
MEELSQLRQLILENNDQGSDMFEIRLDSLKEIDLSELKEILKDVHIPYILSHRSQWIDEEIAPPFMGRLNLLKEIAKLEPPYIRLEYPLDMPVLKELESSTIPIITLFDFEGMAKIAINSVLPLFKKYPNAILKISATPNHVNDILTLWRWSTLLKKNHIDYIIVGIGRLGSVTRIKYKDLGSLWTYGRADMDFEEPEMAGMLPIGVIRRGSTPGARHFFGICDEEYTGREGIIGSMMKGVDPPAVYLEVTIKQIPELHQMIHWMTDRDISGLYICDQWQVQVVDLLDVKDQSVLLSSTCDLVVRTGDQNKGYNTKVNAMINLLEPFRKQINRVYIEGTGFDILSVLTALRNFELDEIVMRTDDTDDIQIFEKIHQKVIHEIDAYSDTYDLFINVSPPAKGFEYVLPVKPAIVLNSKVVIDTFASDSFIIQTARQNQIHVIAKDDIEMAKYPVIRNIWLDID